MVEKISNVRGGQSLDSVTQTLATARHKRTICEIVCLEMKELEGMDYTVRKRPLAQASCQGEDI